MRRQGSTSRQKVTGLDHASKAFALRKTGATYSQIGQALGISTVTAHSHVKRYMDELIKQVREDVKVVRDLEIERLDALLLGLWDRARKGDDKAVNTTLRIMERRSALLGLDAPKKTALEFANTGEGGSDLTVTFNLGESKTPEA